MLDTKLHKVLRTTKKHISLLSSLGIHTVLDFLSYYPRTYTDERNTVPVVDMKLDQLNVVKGRIKSFHVRKSKSGMYITEGIISDSTGSVSVIWFNQRYLEKILRTNREYYFSGKLKYDKGRSVFVRPKVEIVSENMVHTARIVPVYHETEGLISKWIRDKIYTLLKYADLVSDTLPDWVKNEMGLCDLGFAIKNVHFPSSQRDIEVARKRLAFDEVFSLQLKALKIKRAFRKSFSGLVINRADEAMKKFAENLGFSLTKAQRRSLIEMLNDMGRGVPMLRLLQGDVGSGKTIVAALAALNVVKSGYQVAFMVPTEVLAKQHFVKLRELFGKVSICTEILTGATGDKDEIYSKIASGKVDVVIGTHALIQEKVKFKKLGLAIVDEQHRFGVEQRRKLANHGFPHLLSMTATPIPRTLAMIFYGDLDVSIIDELPPSRRKIVTRVVDEGKRDACYKWVYDCVKNNGDQVYVICPLVEDSDYLEEVKSAKAEFKKLSNGPFKGLKVGLLHGRMLSSEKDNSMVQFKAGNIDILVSTSVIEVGVDVANATIMMIEGAERFGLSQLHQFRGRVGRGEKQSYCFLLASKYTPEGVARLSALESNHNGFDLAEIDLKLRGPGEVYGIRQSGIPDLKIASFSDNELIKNARKMADKFLTLQEMSQK